MSTTGDYQLPPETAADAEAGTGLSGDVETNGSRVSAGREMFQNRGKRPAPKTDSKIRAGAELHQRRYPHRTGKDTDR